MFNVRWTLAFALVALVVSLLAGVIGGLPFGLILVRALVGMIVFAALGAAAAWLVQRFIPELMQLGPDGRDEGKTGRGVNERGADKQGPDAEIDITLPEENPHFAGETGNEDDELAGAAYETGAYETGGETGGTGTAAEESEGAGEVAERSIPEEEEEERITSEIPDVDLSDDLGGVDVMPTMGTSQGDYDQGASGHGGGSNVNVEVMGENFDPETAAKAIQTKLKQDKEG